MALILQNQFYNVNGPVIRGFQYAVGDTPEQFDWIGGQLINGVSMTGVHSINPHGLQVGDKVRITVTSGLQKYAGVWSVKHIGADDGSYAESLFVIDTPKMQGDLASGYWERYSGADETQTPDPVIGGVNIGKWLAIGGVTIFAIVMLALYIKKRKK